MDTTQVCIVGAGPAGLALGLSLAKFKIQVSHVSLIVTLADVNASQSFLKKSKISQMTQEVST